MDPKTRNSAIAAAVILICFGVFAFFLPNIMLFVGERSPVAAGVIGVVFVLAFFLVFWLRARQQRGN
jgi:protein-S-isoprenylcysteine O-methyltransferase Ste14